MLFPKFQIDEIKKQDGPRPDALRPRLRPARPLPARVPAADLPDDAARPGRRVARASSSRSSNFYELFNGILNPKQLEGLRLLVTPFPQQQFNATDGSPVSERPSRGVTCFDCHVNGHTNGADAPGRRHPPAGVPPSHRDADAARREHPAAVRLAAGAEDRRGLHGVRAARRLLRRRSRSSPPRRASTSSSAAARSTSWPSSRSSSTSRPPRSSTSTASSTRRRPRRRSCAARSSSSARPSARPATRRRTTPTT